MATLDVRPMMARGEEPFNAIMQTVEALQPGEDFELLAPLDPVPLYLVLGNRGFEHQTENLGQGDYRVVFRKPGTAVPTPPVWNGELTFRVSAEWSGPGRTGSGILHASGQTIAYSVPAAMRGQGEGTNPEELLAAAAVACYSATLSGLLADADLPVVKIRVEANEVVSDYPGPAARVARLTVSPTFVGANEQQRAEYVSAAQRARQRCFIGRHLADTVEYLVGDVGFASDDSKSEVLDVRPFPPARRHQMIFSTLDQLAQGKSIALVNDHDPKPLRYQLEATRPGAFSWDYLEEGPDVWRVHIGRR